MEELSKSPSVLIMVLVAHLMAMSSLFTFRHHNNNNDDDDDDDENSNDDHH